MLIPKVHKIEPLTDEDWERVFEQVQAKQVYHKE
jgi:hypothetical protein